MITENIKNTVVYQIYPRSFNDSNGDGIGDIQGIIQKLDYIAELGANTIWLSPVYASPNADNGYDVSDYRAIHPDFGTMEDFDALIAEAEKRGIKIVMDLVINHTSDEHEWFKRALAGEEKYRDYYIIEKGKNGRLPNNWGNFFAVTPWSPFGGAGEYYLHLFSPKQPDLNWHNPDVFDEVADIMRFWLDKGVAGFRCNVINVIYKNTLKNGRPSLILTGKEHYLSTDGCHEILGRLKKEVLDPYGAFTVGETVFVTVDDAKKLCRELDMVFSFEHVECDQILAKWFKRKLLPNRLMKVLTKWQTALDWNACYFENHDQVRFISRFSDLGGFRAKASKMMAGLLMTLRGTPFIYEGQEIGMVNGDFKELGELRDVESMSVDAMAKKLGLPKKLRWKITKLTSRDNARTPMQWSDEKNGGFTSGKPWLKVNGNYKKLNVKRDTENKNGIFRFWQKAVALRKTSDVLKSGSFRSVYEGKSVYAFEREHGGKRLLSVCNMTGKCVRMPKCLLECNVTLLANYVKLSKKILKPFEFRLVEKV